MLSLEKFLDTKLLKKSSIKRCIRYTLRVLWLKVKKPSCKYQFTRPKILVKTKKNRLSLVLTYISGQVLVFWQEGQKVYKLILQFWININERLISKHMDTNLRKAQLLELKILKDFCNIFF